MSILFQTVKSSLKQESQLPNGFESFHIRNAYNAVNNAIKTFRAEFRSIFSADPAKENKVQNAVKNFNDNLLTLNREFRQKILNLSPDAKQYSMYCLSYKSHKLQKDIEQILNWNYFWNKSSVSFDKRKKPTFSKLKFDKVCNHILAYLFAKYPEAYYFQFQAQIYKCLIEYFDITDMQISDLDDIIDDIERKSIIEIEGVKSMIDDKSVKKPRKKHQKLQLPSKEEYLQFQECGATQKQLQQHFAQTNGVSERTIQRDMAKKGVTLCKYTNYDKRKPGTL